MQPESQNGSVKIEERPSQAGTSFLVSEISPIFDAMEEQRLKEELEKSKDTIQKLFAVFDKK